MSVKRGVVKYMAPKNNGITAAIKKEKENKKKTLHLLIQEDILKGSGAEKPFRTKGWGKAGMKPHTGICLYVQKHLGKIRKGIQWLRGAGDRAEGLATIHLLIPLDLQTT